MKALKHTITFLVIALGIAASPAFAQNAGPNGRQGGMRGFTPEARVQRMAEQLKLNADQQKKILDIYQADAKKLEGLSREQRFAKMQEINQASEPKILEILTSEQQAKYKEMMQNMRQRGAGQGNQGNRGEGGGKASKSPKAE